MSGSRSTLIMVVALAAAVTVTLIVDTGLAGSILIGAAVGGGVALVGVLMFGRDSSQKP